MIVAPTHPSKPRRIARAFTMIELLVSILIVAILMLGINAVFKMSADTVGGGMSILSGMRDLRAAASTFSTDFHGMVDPSEMPYLLIYSQTTPAFRDATDEKSDTAYDPKNPSQAAVLNDPVTGYTTPPFIFNNRNHHTDIIQFFSHGSGVYRRQTGGTTGTLQSAYTSDTALISIGHGVIPDNTGNNYKLPGVMPDPGNGAIQSATSNPNNFYANQWILVRQAILLGTPDGNGKIFDANGVSQDYLQKTNIRLSPLAYNSPGTNGAAIQNSLCDLAGRSSSSLRGDVQSFSGYYGTFNPNWFISLISKGTGSGQDIYRFAVKPWLNKSGNLQNESALTSPILLQGCSQFMVEYAGDYLAQNAAGSITGEGSDGAIDFDYNAGIRSIRWYGLPRSMSLGASISTGASNPQGDVRPLYTYLRTPASFETVTAPQGSLSSYICHWSADELSAPVKSEPGVGAARWPNGTLPWLIRLTIRIDDPNGRLPDGQTLEYIFRTPGH